jgi:glyoxylase-like metal-dependent hydrolase (beta-lactamase superfamily II)
MTNKTTRKPAWTIEAVPTANLLSPGPEVFFQRDFERRVALRIYSFVLRSDAGTVLVDTGLADHTALDADVRARKGEWSGFHDIDPPLVERLLTAPDHIVLTSFGPYTLGGLANWLGRPVHFSARGLADVLQPEVPALARKLSDTAMRVLTGPEARPVSGRAEILPGLQLVEVGAHSPAALGLVIDTADGRIAIADPIFHAENLTRGLSIGFCDSIPDWYRMFGHIGDVDAIMPIHDPAGRLVPRAEWHADLRGVAP